MKFSQFFNFLLGFDKLLHDDRIFVFEHGIIFFQELYLINKRDVLSMFN